MTLLDFSINSVFIFLLSSIGMIFATMLGKYYSSNMVKNRDSDDTLKIVLGTSLSLLGLLIGFTLSMSITGFNSRQQAEEQEAQVFKNAFFRADLLSQPNLDKVRYALHTYIEIRVNTYDTPNLALKERYREDAELILQEIWKTVSNEAKLTPNPVTASVLMSITDLVAAQQKTLADWRHQIPGAAWCLLVAVAICSHFLIGYTASPSNHSKLAVWVLPLLISLSFFMISEIDIPGQGIIRVIPNNLLSVMEQLDQN